MGERDLGSKVIGAEAAARNAKDAATSANVLGSRVVDVEDSVEISPTPEAVAQAEAAIRARNARLRAQQQSVPVPIPPPSSAEPAVTSIIKTVIPGDPRATEHVTRTREGGAASTAALEPGARGTLGPEGATTTPPDAYAVASIKKLLTDEPQQFDRLYALELARPDKRRGALSVFRSAEARRPGGPRPEVIKQLDKKLKA